MPFFNFGELIPNGRVTVFDSHLVAVETVMLVTGKNRNMSGAVLRAIPEEHFSSRKFVERKMPGTGNAKTKLLAFEDAIELIMVLPGKVAKQYRLQFVDIIVRYLDGDKTLVSEIEENSAIGRIKSYTNFANKVCVQIQANRTKNAKDLPETGYVYATKSAAFPGLIKIGKADDMKKRLSTLNTGCSPAPHTIVALAPSFNSIRDERAAHAFFADFRKEGEFFELSEDVIKDYFASSISTQYNREWSEFMIGSEGMCLLDE